MEETTLQLLLTFLLVSLLLCYIHFKTSKKSDCTVPQAPGAWPIIGHLHLFRGQKVLHKTLADVADRCGPVCTIKLGSLRVLVVSDSEFAREIFATHDRNFCDRPGDTASKLLCYNMAMFGFAPYGSYWREMKKVATLELLSSRRIDLLKHIRVSEVKAAMKDLYEKSSKGQVLTVEMREWFVDLTHNISLRMVAGKRYFGSLREGREAQRIQKALKDFAYLFGVFLVSDAIPFLGWLDCIRGYEKDMKRTAKALDDLAEGWLVEHKQKRLVSDGEGKEEQDFMDAMLNIMEDGNVSEFDADTIIKATCLNMVLAGRDTTAAALTWALSLLLNNPNVLKKALDELDSNVGKDRLVDESDIKNLRYLQAVVKETLRLYPPVPVIGLRASLEDCTLRRGYKVPAGTRLMVNVWKIQRDRHVWADPEEFKPERFLESEERDWRGQCFEFLPFGSGRRFCPGASQALQVVQFSLASLLQGFEVGKAFDDEVDMSESSGLSNSKASPLQALLSPRLGSKVYSEF